MTGIFLFWVTNCNQKKKAILNNIIKPTNYNSEKVNFWTYFNIVFLFHLYITQIQVKKNSSKKGGWHMHSCTWLFQHRRHQRNSTVITKSLEHFLKISVPHRNKTFAAKTYINIKNPFDLNKKKYFFHFQRKILIAWKVNQVGDSSFY